MKIKLAAASEIDSWMELVERVKENFPGLETKDAMEEYVNTVLDFMSRESAICAKIDDKVVGTLLFSKEDNMLCFLAVDREYRRQHIGEKMVSLMLTLIGPGKDIAVTTYREGVPEGIAARAFYKKLGFREGRLTEEFGSPVQEYILKRSKRGSVESDIKDFSECSVQKLKKASGHIRYLINEGYSIKSASTFVGNHFLLSERQRLALVRSISTDEQLRLRKEKECAIEELIGKTVHIDGFNTIITLEIALCQSLLLECMDGTIRDLAGLRGTYRLIEVTPEAVRLIADLLEQIKVEKAGFLHGRSCIKFRTVKEFDCRRVGKLCNGT